MSDHHYDYFVIGAGSGGVRSSRIAGSLGAKVGVAEGWHIGGTCVNVGCVPKKIMAYASDYSADFEDARGYGWDISVGGFDWKSFIAKKNAEIERLNGIYDRLLENNNVTYHKGFAKFIDEKTVEVNGQTITADNFLIAVGTTPRKLGYVGEEYTVTSDEVFYLEEQPKHIVIEGGGYIAVEFAHIFHGMGTKVTLVYRGDLFLKEFDDDMSLMLKEEMEKQGINLLFCEKIDHVEKSDQGLRVQLQDGAVIDCDQVLSAIGRVPNTKNLGLEAAGVIVDKNGSVVSDVDNKTSVDHIYAVGDVTNRYQLTPVATAEGEALAQRLFGGKECADCYVDYSNIPTAVFCRPAIATVGYTEKAAEREGIEVRTYKTRFRSMKYILAGRDEYIRMKLVVDKVSEKVIGCHMIGLDAPEIMQGFAVAMKCGATKADFDRTIGIHPTSAEELVTMK